MPMEKNIDIPSPPCYTPNSNTTYSRLFTETRWRCLTTLIVTSGTPGKYVVRDVQRARETIMKTLRNILISLQISLRPAFRSMRLGVQIASLGPLLVLTFDAVGFQPTASSVSRLLPPIFLMNVKLTFPICE